MEQDEETANAIVQDVARYERGVEQLEFQRMFSGKMDSHAAFVVPNDLATLDDGDKPSRRRLRIVTTQVERLEAEIDGLNAGPAPLTSFVLPAGTPAAASAGPRRCSMSTLLLRDPGVISAFGPRTQPPCTYEATIQSFTLCANAARVAFAIAAQSITTLLLRVLQVRRGA